MKIGMFDSGIGGLSILQSTLKSYSDLEIYYVSDDHNAPYGNKSNEFVIERSKSITEVLISKGVELIVVACNTATALAIDKLRQDYPQMKFVGIEPYINIINKGPWGHDFKAVILTTPLMHNSSRYLHLQERLDPDKKLTAYACKDLASIVEWAYYNGANGLEEKVRSELRELLDKQFTHYILGCTHYPLIGDLIKKITNAHIISPCEAISQRVAKVLKLSKNQTKQNVVFQFFSSNTLEWKQMKINLNESLIKY